jgi:hypothetical protein
MKVMRVTEFHSADAAIDRSLFQLLEHFSSFCLIECKRQNAIQIPSECPVLVLDNLDLARDPETILGSVIAQSRPQDVLIVVDHQPDNWLLASAGLRPVVHLVLGSTSHLHHKPNRHQPDVPATSSITTALACLEHARAA